ncbi:hypothetical protein P22_1751 [Propionispora sp. 2/2-37]|uniref:acyl-CoA dehydratase activase-related protein n=1 Tax=Propionispora sp. 2/2-37 TaxID=1677858 RepID=UPI0006BB6F72|nr:acyl-CoA dehydratase activase-related protein [Propionispora sp. 2/2-37]CUH95675.1 hypothetical protein P22_1751 [Propionispora sp. 2/2-37]
MQQYNIGIPQALLFHEFGSLWREFFKKLDIPVTLSGETNKGILDRGTALAIDESCLPLKVYLGHVDKLLPQCSHIFVPRIAQYHRNFHFCAKFAGLPDIISNTFGVSPERLLAPNVENQTPLNRIQAVNSICRGLGISPLAGQAAYHHAVKAWRSQISLKNGYSSQKIGLVGHNYLVRDSFFCRDIIKTLQSQGATIITPDDLPGKMLYEEAQIFVPDLYWQLSAKLAGAARYFCRQSGIQGIMLVSSFGCGPDSLVNEYLEHHILQPSKKPYIVINLDEHTGSAGIITRVEAFWDLVNRRALA